MLVRRQDARYRDHAHHGGDPRKPDEDFRHHRLHRRGHREPWPALVLGFLILGFRQQIVTGIGLSDGGRIVGPRRCAFSPCLPSKTDPVESGADRSARARAEFPRDAVSGVEGGEHRFRSRCCAMSDTGIEPVVELKGLTRSFEQGGVRIDVLRGVDLAIKPGEIVALAGPIGLGANPPCCRRSACSKAGFWRRDRGSRAHSAEKSDSRAPAPCCGASIWASFTSSHHLLPDFDARENVILPQLVAGRLRAEAEAPRRTAARRAGPRTPARP